MHISYFVNCDEMIVKVGPLAVYSMNASYKKTSAGKVIYTPGYCRVEVKGSSI